MTMILNFCSTDVRHEISFTVTTVFIANFFKIWNRRRSFIVRWSSWIPKSSTVKSISRRWITEVFFYDRSPFIFRKRSVSSILWVLSWFLRRILHINLKLSDCCYTSNFESQTSSLSDDVMILTNFILLQIMMTTTYDMIYLIFFWYLCFLRIQLQRVTNIVDFIITFFFPMLWQKYRDFVFVIIVREEDNISIIIQMKNYYIVVLWRILNLE